jgi:hypothetical protein
VILKTKAAFVEQAFFITDPQVFGMQRLAGE